MDFIRINSKDDKYFDDAMNVYQSSFPIFEQRTMKDQIDALEDNRYYCTVICDNDIFIGLLFYWKFENYIYIEHLAISPNLRGQNYGSKILTVFCKENPNTILEIDPPIDKVSINRLHFYSKLGFKLQPFTHVHPPYRNGNHGHDLKILSFNRDLEQEEYDKFNVFLKNIVMIYSENI